MEIFRAPRVTLLARPEFLEPEHLRVEWRGEASPGERLAEYAGRLCYMSQHNTAQRTTVEYLEKDRKSTRLNSSHLVISYAVFCLKKKKKENKQTTSNSN